MRISKTEIRDLLYQLKNESQTINSETGKPFHFQDYWDNCYANNGVHKTLNGDDLLLEISRRIGCYRTQLLGTFSEWKGWSELAIFTELLKNSNKRDMRKQLRISYDLRLRAGVINEKELSFSEFFRGYLRMLAKTSYGISIEAKVISLLKEKISKTGAKIHRAPKELEGYGIDFLIETKDGRTLNGSIKSGASLRSYNLLKFQEQKPVNIYAGIDEYGVFRIVNAKKLTA